MARFRRIYGAGLGHLVAFVLALAVTGFAVRRIFDQSSADTLKVFVWLGGAIIVHDLVALPLYSLVDRVLSRRPAAGPGPARLAPLRTHLRVPMILSGLLLLVFAPLILRKSAADYSAYSSLSEAPYLHRWLIATAVLFGLSGAVYGARVAAWSLRRRGGLLTWLLRVRDGLRAWLLNAGDDLRRWLLRVRSSRGRSLRPRPRRSRGGR